MKMKSFLLVSLLLGTASVSASASTAASRDNHVKDVIEWLRAKGGTVNSKLDIRRHDLSDPTSKFGIFANDKIQEGDILFEVPPECVLTGEPFAVGDKVSANYEEEGYWFVGTVVRVNSDGTFNINYEDGDKEHGVNKQYIISVMDDGPSCSVVRSLIKEIKLGDDSKYAAYVNYLKDQSTGQLPSAWSDEGKAVLREVLQNHLPPDEASDWSWETQCQGSQDPLEENAAMIVIQSSRDDRIIPIFDVMSTRNGHWTNAYVIPVRGSSRVVVQASRDIKAGEEIYYWYRTEFGFGTPEFFRDFGILERYPQRWFLYGEEVAFQLDEIINTDGSNSGKLKINWLLDEPTEKGITYCKEQLKRLESLTESKLKTPPEGVPKNEGDAIEQYTQALITALKYAIDGAVDQVQCIFNKNNQCKSIDAMFDTLEENFDESDYHEGETELNDYVDVESIKSAYQEIVFAQDPVSKDTCFDLDGITQICGSYRPHYHEMVVHYTARFFDKIKRVLWVGGGDSMLLHEIIKYPTLELVVGLEIDQKVTRGSFKHFGTQPHWDNEKVQWYYGDAAKSLLMLPKDYFASFDMVLVDLSETVMSIQVTRGLDIFGALALLLKPEGIIVKNELYLNQFSELFDYTTQLHIYDFPVIDSQALVLGSNHIDFFKRIPKEHNIENLFIKPLDESSDSFDIWHDYRRNDVRVKQNCRNNDDPDKEPVKQGKSPGILMILEAEDATQHLSPSQEVEKYLAEALRKEGLVIMDAVHLSSNSGATVNNGVELVFVLREGYVVARTWPDHKYCAFDIHLWSSFEKQDDIRKGLIAAVGSNRDQSSSSYRIVAGGMFGVSTWKEDEKNRGPRFTEPCDRPTEVLRETRMDRSIVESIVQESMSLVEESSTAMVVVFCGHETELCESFEALSKSDTVGEVVAVWTCPDITEGSAFLEGAVGHMFSCKRDILKTLKEVTAEEKKIRIMIIDSSAPFAMGQLVHKIFDSKNNRQQLLSADIMVMAPMLDPTEMWRKNLMDRFRKDVIRDEPVFRAEVLFNSSDSSMELSLTLSGDPAFFRHLLDVTSNIEKSIDLVTELRNVEGGEFDFPPDFVPSQFFLPGDYDQRSPHAQWKSQQPMGRQTVFQFEVRSQRNNGKDGEHVLSTINVKAAVEEALAQMKEGSMGGLDVKEFAEVGDGSIIVVLWRGGSLIVLWDGGLHVDINLFTYSQNVNIHNEFEKHFKKQIPLLETVLKDEQPRGFGRVVNFSEDIEPRVDAHWALGIKDE